jgi:hypothetical protein
VVEESRKKAKKLIYFMLYKVDLVLLSQFSLAQPFVTLNFGPLYHLHPRCLDGICVHISPLDQVFRDTRYIPQFDIALI